MKRKELKFRLYIEGSKHHYAITKSGDLLKKVRGRWEIEYNQWVHDRNDNLEPFGYIQMKGGTKIVGYTAELLNKAFHLGFSKPTLIDRQGNIARLHNTWYLKKYSK